jgi:outer membrane protein assembly factor BamA
VIRGKLLFIVPCILGWPVSASSQQNVSVNIKTLGSVPEVPGLYDCVWHLEKEPYSQARVQSCLQSIAATKYFIHTEIKTRSLDNGRLQVTFLLKSPSLRVRAFTIDLGDSESSRLKAWLQHDPNAIRVGSDYDRRKEVATKTGIERYYAAQGISVGVSSTVDLDYPAHSAKVVMNVYKGPTKPEEPVFPPYGTLCPDRVGALGGNDFDEWVPASLVRQIVKLRNIGSCFSEDTLNADRRALIDSELFTDVTVSAEGPPASRSISLKLRGKPIKVVKVEASRFGLHGGETFDRVAELPLKAGDVYQREKGELSIKMLQGEFKAPGEELVVSERDELTQEHLLIVHFDVLSFPKDQLSINGLVAQDSGTGF